MVRSIPAAAALLLLAGCTVGPNFSTPDWLSPTTWFAKKPEATVAAKSLPVAEPIDPTWWNLFNDPQLTALEHRVADENLEVQAATVRLAESRAQLGIAGAAQFPGLNANASYRRRRASGTRRRSRKPNGPMRCHGTLLLE